MRGHLPACDPSASPDRRRVRSYGSVAGPRDHALVAPQRLVVGAVAGVAAPRCPPAPAAGANSAIPQVLRALINPGYTLRERAAIDHPRVGVESSGLSPHPQLIPSLTRTVARANSPPLTGHHFRVPDRNGRRGVCASNGRRAAIGPATRPATECAARARHPNSLFMLSPRVTADGSFLILPQRRRKYATVSYLLQTAVFVSA